MNTKWLESCKIETTQQFKENCRLRAYAGDYGPVKRYVTFFNAFIYDEEYTSEFTIYMKFTNPKDNFPRD